jgi:membrane-associated phospholipid phosphatase
MPIIPMRRCLAALFLAGLLGPGAAVAQDQNGSRTTQAPTLAELPRHLLADAKKIGSRDPLLTLAVGGAAAAAVHPRDQQTVVSLSGNHPLEEALDAGNVAGNGFVQAGGAIAIFAAGRTLGHPALAAVGGDLVEAQIVAGALTQGIKFAAERRRPDGGRYSFPSGHASASFATAGVIEERFGWRYGAAAYAGASYIAASRVADRRHYLSDVIFGAAIGTAAAHTLKWSTGERWSLWPGVTPHGVALNGMLVLAAR